MAAAVTMVAALVVFSACGSSGASDSPKSPGVLTASGPTKAASGAPTASPQPIGFTYRVVEGDTLSSISQRFGVAVDEIAAVNKLTDAAKISIGQMLFIPGGDAGSAPSPVASPAADARLTGFAFPIEGACLPSSDNLMPNAPREYRAGVHEGVDFYTGSCVDVPQGAPVLAAKPGKVVRADAEFVEMTEAELNELLSRSLQQGYTDERALDRFRGRQVWVDHGNGVQTRYCHLNGIATGITQGAEVQAGQLLGYVGDSGTPEAVTAPGTEIHLHFEIRVGDSFLGAGLPPDQVRTLYERALSAS